MMSTENEARLYASGIAVLKLYCSNVNLGENTEPQGSLGYFLMCQTTGTSGLARKGLSCVLGHKNNISCLFYFFFFFFDVNACVKVGSWNVFKLSLEADGGSASVPWFHFMGRGHVDKSSTRITDK